MKTSRMILLVMAAAACTTFAASNVVSSANVVGYNQISMPSNQLVLVALSFDNASNTVSGLFGNLPTGSEVNFWNPVSQTWVVAQKTRSGWGTSGTNQLFIGSGAFVKVPAATNIYLSGDVPMDATTTVYTVAGLQFASFPYPVDMPFTNTALAKGSLTGDEVSIWDNGWTVYQKTRSGWGAGTNLQIKVGQAFFYKGNTNRAANEIKPYTIDDN